MKPRYYKNSKIEPMIGDIVTGIGPYDDEVIVSYINIYPISPDHSFSNNAFDGKLSLNIPERVIFIRRGK